MQGWLVKGTEAKQCVSYPQCVCALPTFLGILILIGCQSSAHRLTNPLYHLLLLHRREITGIVSRLSVCQPPISIYGKAPIFSRSFNFVYLHFLINHSSYLNIVFACKAATIHQFYTYAVNCRRMSWSMRLPENAKVFFFRCFWPLWQLQSLEILNWLFAIFNAGPVNWSQSSTEKAGSKASKDTSGFTTKISLP